MFFPSFLLFSVVLPTVFAANDWSKPCTSGTCSYEAGDGTNSAWSTILINGDGNTISDITVAAGWMIMGCESGTPRPQDIRIVCTNPSLGCSHLFQGGAEDTIVRLPEECGSGPFARVHKTWVHEDQSLPAGVPAKVKRANNPVRGLAFDFNFGAIPASRGRVGMTVTATNNPAQRSSPSTIKRSLHSFVRHSQPELQRRGFFGDFVNKGKAALSKVTAPVQKAVQQVARPIAQSFVPVFQKAKAVASSVVKPVLKKVKAVAAPVSKAVSKVVKPVATKVKQAAAKVVKPVKAAAKKVVKPVKAAAKKVVAGASAAKKKVTSVVKQAGKAVASGAKSAEKKVESAGKKVIDKAEDAGKKAVSKAKELGTDIVDGAKDLGGDIVDGAKKVIDKTKEVGSDIVEGAEKVIDKGKEIGSDIIDGAEKVIDKGKEIGSDIVDGVKDAGSKAIDVVGDAAQDAVDVVEDAVEDANNFDQTLTKDFVLFDLKRNFPIFDTSISCPAKGKVPAFDAAVSVNVDVDANASVALGIALTGTIVPPAIDDLAVTAVLTGGAKATFNVKANAEGKFDTGSIPLFKAGLPGLSFPGIITIGPSFSVNGQASVAIGVVADMKVTAAWDLPRIELVFPPNQGASSANVNPAAAPVALSVGASVDLTGKAEAHLIPRIDLGIDVLNGLAKATVFLDLDAFGVLDFNAKATASADNSGNKEASFGGCIGLDAGIAVTAGAEGALGPIFEGSKSFDIFRKQVDIFDKCFGDQAKRDTVLLPRSLSGRALALTCPGAPGKAKSVVDETAIA